MAARRDKPGEKARLKLWPLLLLAAAVAAAAATGVGGYLRYDALAEHFTALQQAVQTHPVLALAALIAVYALGTAVSVPAMSVVTLMAGALYGLLLGTIGVALGATIGATAIFYATRTSLGVLLSRRAGPWLKRLQGGFRRNEFFYLLALRLVPLVPFWVLNIVPALIGMRLRNYVAATFLGILPGVLVYVSIGAGAASVLASGERPDIGAVLLQPHILLPLIGLALLALLPIPLRRWGPIRTLFAERNGSKEP